VLSRLAMPQYNIVESLAILGLEKYESKYGSKSLSLRRVEGLQKKKSVGKLSCEGGSVVWSGAVSV